MGERKLRDKRNYDDMSEADRFVRYGTSSHARMADGIRLIEQRGGIAQALEVASGHDRVKDGIVMRQSSRPKTEFDGEIVDRDEGRATAQMRSGRPTPREVARAMASGRQLSPQESEVLMEDEDAVSEELGKL